MTDCDKYIEWISAWLDGALSPAEARELEDHLTQCPECRALARDLKEIHDTLAALPGAQPPAGLTERILASLPPDNVVPLPVKKGAYPWVRWAASAAALALVLLGAWGMREVGRTKTADSTPEAAFFQTADALSAENREPLYEAETTSLPPDDALLKTSLRTAGTAAAGVEEGPTTEGSETVSDNDFFDEIKESSPVPEPASEATPALASVFLPTTDAYVNGAPALTPRQALELLLEERNFSGYDDQGEEWVTWPWEGDTQELLAYSALSDNGRYHIFFLSSQFCPEDGEDLIYTSRIETYAVSLDGGEVLDGSDPMFWAQISN